MKLLKSIFLLGVRYKSNRSSKWMLCDLKPCKADKFYYLECIICCVQDKKWGSDEFQCILREEALHNNKINIRTISFTE